MFEIGDFVVKANNGICRIDDIGYLDIASANKKRLYFYLVPLEDNNTKLYVPVDKKDNGIRKVVTEEEAWKLIDEIPEIEEAWITDDKLRDQKYKETIQSCDLEKLISIIKNMYNRKQKRTAMGKKNTSIDEHFFRVAENNLYTELAFAIGKNKEDMQQIICEKIAAKTKQQYNLHTIHAIWLYSNNCIWIIITKIKGYKAEMKICEKRYNFLLTDAK